MTTREEITKAIEQDLAPVFERHGISASPRQVAVTIASSVLAKLSEDDPERVAQALKVLASEQRPIMAEPGLVRRMLDAAGPSVVIPSLAKELNQAAESSAALVEELHTEVLRLKARAEEAEAELERLREESGRVEAGTLVGSWADDVRELSRIREHVRSYGLIPEGERDGKSWTVADVVTNSFVSHCAVEVCSAHNEPGSHWCRRHQDFLIDTLRELERLRQELARQGRLRRTQKAAAEFLDASSIGPGVLGGIDAPADRLRRALGEGSYDHQ